MENTEANQQQRLGTIQSQRSLEGQQQQFTHQNHTQNSQQDDYQQRQQQMNAQIYNQSYESPKNDGQLHHNINQFTQNQQQDQQQYIYGSNFMNQDIQNRHDTYQQQQHYTNQNEFIEHLQSDFRYFIINVFYQLIKNSLYLIIFAQTAQFAFQKYESNGCYTGSPMTQQYQTNIQKYDQSSSNINEYYSQYNDNYTLHHDHHFHNSNNTIKNHYVSKPAPPKSTQNTKSTQQQSQQTSQPDNKSGYSMLHHENGQSLVAMVFNGNIGLIFLNLISLVYLYVQNTFIKLEFNIVYILNLSFSILVLCYSLYDSSQNPYVCYSAKLFHQAFLYITIKKEVEVGMLIYKEISDLTLRQFNICSNTIFAYLLIMAPNQAHCSANAQTLVFSIEVTNIMALLIFTFFNFGYRKCSLTDDARRALKFVVIILVATFFMVYVMVLYNFNSDKISYTDDTCFPLRYVLRNYQYVVPISMLGMIFIFHSLNKNFDEEFSFQGHEKQLTLHQEDQENKQDKQQLQNQSDNQAVQSPDQQQSQQQQQQQQNIYQQNSQQQQSYQNLPVYEQNQQQQTPYMQRSFNQGQQNLQVPPGQDVFKYQEQPLITLEQLRNSYRSSQNQGSPYQQQVDYYQQQQYNNSPTNQYSQQNMMQNDYYGQQNSSYQQQQQQFY